MVVEVRGELVVVATAGFMGASEVLVNAGLCEGGKQGCRRKTFFFINPKLYKITINNNTYNNSIHTQFDLSLKLIHTSIF